MKTRRPLVGAAVAAATIIGLGGTAFAGEWAPGHGETPIKTRGVAASECAFSGRDQADFDPDTNPGGELPGPEGPDDGLWGSTPAKGHAQSPGQLVAAGINPAGIPGQACRGGGPAGD